MCQGMGLSKHDMAVRLSEATGRGFENVLMDLNRVSSGPLWVDQSRISEKAFGQFAKTQGLSDWDAAGLVSDMTGMGIENAHHKLTAIDIGSLPSSSIGTPLPGISSGSPDPIRSVRAGTFWNPIAAGVSSFGTGTTGAGISHFSTHLILVSGNSIANGPACACGNRGWLLRESYAKCSDCGRTRDAKVRAYVVDGPECCCGGHDWLIGQSGARCTSCDRYREAKVQKCITSGPICCCGSRGWFVGESGVRCASCDRWRQVNFQGIIVGGPECACGEHDWFVGKSGHRCSSCDRWR